MEKSGDRIVLGPIGATLIVVMVVLAMIFIKVPFTLIPGGPKLPQLPDLVIDSIQAADGVCTDFHTATFEVTVAIRNAGLTTATLPPWKNWILIWSVTGGTAPPFRAGVTAPPGQLAAGQTATLKAKVAGIAKVTPDKQQSALT